MPRGLPRVSRSFLVAVLRPLSFLVSMCGFQSDCDDAGCLDDMSLLPLLYFSEGELDSPSAFSLRLSSPRLRLARFLRRLLHKCCTRFPSRPDTVEASRTSSPTTTSNSAVSPSPTLCLIFCELFRLITMRWTKMSSYGSLRLMNRESFLTFNHFTIPASLCLVIVFSRSRKSATFFFSTSTCLFNLTFCMLSLVIWVM